MSPTPQPRSAAGGDRAILLALVVLVVGPVAAYLVWDLQRTGALTFKHPFALLLLLAVPLTFWVRTRLAARRSPHLAFSSTAPLAAIRRGVVSRLSGLPAVLRTVAIGLLAVALARPQTHDRGGRVEVEGIDIVVALDMSNSMEAIDLHPSRLEAAKRVLDDFISRRRSDRIGLVVFGKDAFTHCPLTLDYSALRTMLAELRLGAIDGSATAIGNALGVSLARLRKSDAKSKVAILLTDGENNSGNVTPIQAARYAQAMGVKVFTILMGAREGEVTSGRDLFGRPIQVQRQYPVNPALLQEIAKTTGGRAYLATDREALEKNFESILDELDRSTRRDVAAIFLDAYRPFAALVLVLLLGELLLGLTRMRRFP
jgi:Ca-activated chloride channel homolog